MTSLRDLFNILDRVSAHVIGSPAEVDATPDRALSGEGL